MFLSSWLGKTVVLSPDGMLSKKTENASEALFDEDLFLEELNKRRKTSKKKEDKGITFDTTGTY